MRDMRDIITKITVNLLDNTLYLSSDRESVITVNNNNDTHR